VREVIDTVETLMIPHTWKVTVVLPMEGTWKVTVVEQKEDKVRLYAKMISEMRLYQTATESNIAESVFPYLPQQRKQGILKVEKCTLPRPLLFSVIFLTSMAADRTLQRIRP